MTVTELSDRLGFETVTLDDGGRIAEGCYAGDLLSWVMGRAKPGNVWFTIMTNINVLAVASLLDISCVVICENAELSGDFVRTASEKGVNILRTDKPVYEACVAAGSLLK